MTLEECSSKDFSDFDTFNNYCVLMFYFHCLNWQFSLSNGVNLEIRSPQFLGKMAAVDDVFLINGSKVSFDPERYKGKIHTRYDEILDRTILRKAPTSQLTP
jgi:hypothetical protein